MSLTTGADPRPDAGAWVRRALRVAWRPLLTAVVIAVGLVVRAAAPASGYGQAIWYAGLALTGTGVVWQTVRGALRGQFAADVVATLAIITAVAVGEPFVGLVIVLMQTGGEALERYAEGRASGDPESSFRATPSSSTARRTSTPRCSPASRYRSASSVTHTS